MADSHEMAQIRHLRARTRKLMQELWEAQKDGGHRQPTPEAIAAVLEDRPVRYPPRSPGKLSPSRSRSQSPSKRVSKSRPASPSRQSSPARPSSPRSKLSRQQGRLGSPPKIHVPPVSPAQILKAANDRQERMFYDTLYRDDQYYDDLQLFRKANKDQFIRDPVPKSIPEVSHVQRVIAETRNQQEISAPFDPSVHYAGAFRVNKRLMLERIQFPFNSLEDAELFTHEELRNLAEDEPPVKVSIPKSLSSKIVKTYRPHRRRSFDPGDAIDIGAFLHKGYESHLRTTQMVKRIGTEGVSLARETAKTRAASFPGAIIDLDL
ncbi:uncharacterized protein BJ171DRAFT_167032 [Polychytrium aggregatum]|uniref:uncharacterized protein n=1 Tax=Polychytrium aggregatum TaxID=110093 RepID=UPI0022FF345D|nr:uncharacterized protein BJ171DRAFT_167032 [Polychytrium aggregatum]KAI9202781.1 hypothetical protein BJ171DRAFT_167032 [Polychytrium aggregatum]